MWGDLALSKDAVGRGTCWPPASNLAGPGACRRLGQSPCLRRKAKTPGTRKHLPKAGFPSLAQAPGRCKASLPQEAGPPDSQRLALLYGIN